MKERPILFNGEMVRAILEGRKTQTRRVVKGNPGRLGFSPFACKEDDYLDEHGRQYSCPYGVSGDRLWVRETWCTNTSYNNWKPRDLPVGCPIWYRAQADDDISKWRPSIFMPRWASRINLEVKGVRVERVQDITEEGAMAEGVNANPYYMSDGTIDDMMSISALANFEHLWNSINAKRGYGWETNPWVWVVEFELLDGRRHEEMPDD